MTWMAIGSPWKSRIKIPLLAVRLCKMDVTPCLTLDMCRSLHLIFSYILKNEQRDLKSKSLGWICNMRG